MPRLEAAKLSVFLHDMLIPGFVTDDPALVAAILVRYGATRDQLVMAKSLATIIPGTPIANELVTEEEASMVRIVFS
jgi:hypothetical protein